MRKKIYTYIILLLTPLFGAAQTVHYVDTDEAGFSPSNGTLTLEMAINNAVSGDSILIDFSGTLVLTNQLLIDKDVTIIGPNPIHFNIDGSNIPGGDAVIIDNSGGNVDILGLGFSDYSADASMVIIQSGTTVEFKRCMFQDNTNSTSPGAAIHNKGSLTLMSCSFRNNFSAQEGGAIYSAPEGTGAMLVAQNCCFMENTASQGGAIFLESGGSLDHCTFFQNAATVEGGGVFATNNIGSFAVSSCFMDPSNGAPVGENFYNQGGGLTSSGNNLMDDDNGAGGVFVQPSDRVGGGYIFGLRSAGPKLDGYGLYWIPIENQLSEAIDNGGAIGVPRDIRLAPRVLNGASDIGAVEYTPYTVKNNGTAFESLNWALTQSSIDGAVPAYIDFDIQVGGTAIANSAVYNIQISPTIIDGFTQPNSKVPGPRNATTPASSGYTAIMLDGLTAIDDGIFIGAGYDDCEISGLGFVNHISGIVSTSNYNWFYGNHFGTNEQASDAANSVQLGIRIQSTENIIGGSSHHERNVFGGCSTAGIFIESLAGNQHGIYNNIFGIPGNGAGNYTNANMMKGVRLEGGPFTEINSNYFGNCETGISIDGVDDVQVLNNTIGYDYAGYNPLPMNANGIEVIGSSFCDIGSSGEGNWIGNCVSAGMSGVVLDNCSDITVADNVIGVAGDEVTAAPNRVGILVVNSSIDINIDDNVISANTKSGIEIENSSNTYVHGNFVGLDVSGTASNSLGNDIGIEINNSTANDIGSAAQSNFISDNISHGIEMTGTNSLNNYIQGNYIGYESDGTTAAGNGGNGVRFAGNTNGNIVGGPTQGNTIGHNSGHGISLFTDANSNMISHNLIDGNVMNGIHADGSSTNQNTYSRNDIRNNGGLGIRNDVGANQSIQIPEIIGVTECVSGSQTTVRVKLQGLTTGSSYIVEFFTIPNGDEDPSGFGEGNNYWTDQTVTASVSGTEEFTFSLPFTNNTDFISCTYTDPAGNTSEFSNHVQVASPPPTTTINTSTDPSCAGASDGAIDIDVSGGTPTYSYSWDDGSGTQIGNTQDLSALSADTYTLTLTDTTGCQTLFNYTINDPMTLGGTASVTSNYGGYGVSCWGSADGVIDVSPTGGTMPYSISFDGGSTFPVTGVTGSHTESGLGAGTYDIVIEDAAGCSYSTSTLTITEPSGLNAFPGGSDPSCNGSTDGSVSATGSGGVSPYTYDWYSDAGLTTPVGSGSTVTGLGAGTYYVEVTDANGCTTSDQVTLTDPLAITFSVTLDANVTCYGGSDGAFTVNSPSGGTAPYTYSIDGGGTFGGSNTFTGLSAGNYDVVVQDASGCVSAITTQSVSEPPQLLSTSSSTDETCFGDNDGTLTLVVTGGTGPYTYNWYYDAAYTMLAYSNNSASATNTVTGVDPNAFYPEVIDANGCYHYDASVVINTGIVVSANTMSSDETCAGAMDGSVSASPSGGTAPYDIQWYDDAALTNNIGSGSSLSGLGTGWYYVVVTEQSNSCSAIDSAQVSSPPALVYDSASVTDPSCNGSFDGQISATMSGGTAPYEISVDGGSSYPYGGSTASGLGSGTYTVFVMDANGCVSGPHLETLTDPAPITVDAGPDTSVCYGSSIQLNGSVTVASGGMWSTSGSGTFSTASSLSTTYTPSAADQSAGSVTITLTSTGNGSCAAVNDQLILTVNPLDDASFTYSDFCADDGGSPVVTGTNGGSFSFDMTVSNGETITPSTGNISGAVAGVNYTIQYVTNGICPDSSSMTAQAIANPVISTSVTDPTCWNTTDGEIVIGATGGTTPYQFSIDGGMNLQGSDTFSNLTGGIYECYVEDLTGCSDTATVTLVTPSQPTVTIADTLPTCFGYSDGDLVITAAGGAGPNYQVTVNGGANWATIPAGGFTYNLSSIPAGTYDIAVMDVNGCSSDTITYILDEPDEVVASAITSPDTCGFGIAGIDLSGSNGGTMPFDYSIDGGVSFQSSAQFTGLTSGTYDVIVVDANGCNDTLNNVSLGGFSGDFSFLMSVSANEQNVCDGEEVLLNVTPSAVSYSWTGNVNDPTIQSPVGIVTADSNTFIVDIAVGTCFGTDSITIGVDSTCGDTVIIDNAFSPNGDGINDLWIIEATQYHPDNKVFIVNRWGDEVHSFVNYDNVNVVWDGTDRNGNELPNGTYFYVIQFTELDKQLSGWVQITK